MCELYKASAGNGKSSGSDDSNSNNALAYSCFAFDGGFEGPFPIGGDETGPMGGAAGTLEGGDLMPGLAGGPDGGCAW